MSQSLDELFLIRARERGLLSESQVRSLRAEIVHRRRHEPDLGAHELAVEKGWLGVEAALALLDAKPEDTIADLTRRISEGELQRYELSPSPDDDLSVDSLEPESSSHSNTERYSTVHDIEIEPDADEEHFAEVPKLVEPLPSRYAISDQPSSDSHLEMELPPPASDSGDSIFDDSDSKQVPALDAEFDEPVIVERTPSGRRVSSAELVPIDADTALGDSLADLDISADDMSSEEEVIEQASSGDTLLNEHLYPIRKDTERFEKVEPVAYRDPGITATDPRQSDAGRTASDTSTDESGKLQSAPAFAMKGQKGASQDFASFGEDDMPAMDEVVDESEEVSSKMLDSAVGEVMEQADDSYFGPPVDLTTTPPELMEDSIAPPRPMDASTLFDSEALRGKKPEQDESFVATAPPGGREAQPSSEFHDDSEVSVTIPGEFPADELATIYDESQVGATDEPSNASTGSHVTTGSNTQFATGEQVRPGLRNRTDSKIGVESASGPGSDIITGKEMTLADLRQQMGIGQGVKIGDRPTSSIKRLKQASKKKRYAVVREIARGGMGKVIEVEDNDLRRSVALKVLRKEMLDRKDLVERFLEEAQITGQLEHPNIVPVHEIGVDGRGNLYFTMKLVEGEELSSIIKRLKKKDPSAEQAWPLSRLVDIFIKVCEGVAFAHSRGVIHRDLKPANIMVGRFGEVQIMDWGVAKIIGRKEDTADRAVVSDRRDDDAAQTMVGSILGTPSYMSPEQARGEVNTMGAEADIFSLGVILYEMLCLVTPWTAQTSAQVLQQVKDFSPEPPSKRAPDRRVPPELEQLAMKCIEKAAHRRIATAPELIDNLKSWQEGRTLAAVEYSIGQLIGKWISRHRVGLIMVILVLGALSAGGIVAYNAVQQAAAERAQTSIADADELLEQARKEVTARDWQAAEETANLAFSKYQGALDTLGSDERASAGAQEATNVGAEARIGARTEREESERIERETQQQKRLNAALVAARELFEAAKKADGSSESSKAREAFIDAGKAFERVLVIDDSNAEARLAVGQINDWQLKYETRRSSEEEMKKLRALVGDARTSLTSAVATADYKQAAVALQQTISLCDQAIAVSVADPAGGRLRDDAQAIKAESALAFATRAMDGGHYDVADLMLNTAGGTGKLTARINDTRAVLDQKVEAQSRFTRLLTAARTNITNKEWVLAQSSINEAIKEAGTSSFATDADRSELARMLQLARLEELRSKDTIAKSSDDLGRILGDYQALLPALTDPDYNARALTYIDELGRRLGDALYAEAQESEDDRVAGDLLTRALAFITDKSKISDIKTRLQELKVRLAMTEESDRQVLLPRGTFVLGSNREGDNNPQHTYEHNEFVFVDKYLVTNEEYQQFVEAGGYAEQSYWQADALPWLSLLVDSTGKPGPANWADGGFDASLANYPVTGISCYEAQAYARWAGMRLPTADEWEIAAGAPRTDGVAVGDYPFGAREAGPSAGVIAAREVGTTEWDGAITGARDLGSNVAEWTSSSQDGKTIVKGAEPGLRAELFFRYARRAKHSMAQGLDRSTGRGFRCAKDLTLTEDKDD